LHLCPTKGIIINTMQRFIFVGTVVLVCALLPMRPLHAQGFDPQLAGEVNTIRAELARSNMALHRYSWTEHTEVLVNGKLKSASDADCHYAASGQIVKVPFDANEEKNGANVVSKRPNVRKKADLEDYIDRAVSLIAFYVPPDPVQIDAMLARGDASVEPSTPGHLQVRFKGYHQRGDSMIFSYDPVSKALLRVTVLSTLGSPKDPVKMDAVFETLPDGVNHLASTTVTAATKKIEVKTRNLSYKQGN
jgi:hypothetical protein